MYESWLPNQQNKISLPPSKTRQSTKGSGSPMNLSQKILGWLWSTQETPVKGNASSICLGCSKHIKIECSKRYWTQSTVSSHHNSETYIETLHFNTFYIILLPFQNAAHHPPPASPSPRPPGEHGDDTGDIGETGAASPAPSPESDAWRGETRKVTCQGPWI